ncbi:hypothetical protein, partial [Bacteroides heparinolyticus]|uniref:hypothetical protein n=1 Tax=Prevotella heparinolytica TaxID=28113 RepID=UPI0035A0DCB0
MGVYHLAKQAADKQRKGNEDVSLQSLRAKSFLSFTGATSKLSADNVKMDGIPDISRALEGRAAGVSVQNVSGTFGT